MSGLTYSGAGVDSGEAARETGALARILRETAGFRRGAAGEPLLEIGYYASVLRLTDELALAVCTDGVGSKLLVAEMLGKYDTVGIDCIAMNVNDLVCVGAEPLCLVDYVGIERLRPGIMEALARGLLEGARRARISIPGGETAQLPEIIRGNEPGSGLDLVGTAVGTVPVGRINCGSEVEPGDVVLGLRSSGVHSNGLTLARRALFDRAGHRPDQVVPELGRTVGEELLEPTRIYVREALRLWGSGLRVKACCHITGDGLLNLNRVAAEVGFEIDALPEPPPVFELIRKAGSVETAEMFRVFNMGIGLAVVVAAEDAERALAIAREEGCPADVIGRVVPGPEKRVLLRQHDLVGTGTEFAAGASGG